MACLSITINGNGSPSTDDAGRVFFVESGTVAINNVIIANALAQGGDGGDANNDCGGGGGGGLAPARRCSSMPARW